VELKLNWTHKLLVSADDVNMLGDNSTVKKNTKTKKTKPCCLIP
jgi:hypothetical protein